MTDRPKRVITKPPRYQTTSSEENVKLKKMQEPQATSIYMQGDFEQDVGELRNILEEPDNSSNYNNTINTQPHTFPQIASTHKTQTPYQQTSASQPTPTQHPHTMSQNIPGPSSSHYNIPLHNYDKQIEMQVQQKTYYTNSQHSQFQIMPSPTEQPRHFHEVRQSAATEIPQTIQPDNQKMNVTLQNILQCLETNRDRKRVPRKPASLPISSCAEMDAFETINDDEFREVVGYFNYVGGFNLKEVVNLCLKEAMTDDITPSFTWWGRQGGPRPLYNARIVIAIYEATCGNRHFTKPTRSEFQIQMREALRAAKQRCRNKACRSRTVRTDNRARNFWNDEADDPAESDE